MSGICKLTQIQLAILLGIALLPVRAQAQWWSSKEPVDYEDCVARGEKTATNSEAKTALASQCDAKFAGRRKPSGGYTYFDFMQNRSFDIAGPNPTPEELRKMDEQYTEFLDQRRKRMIAAAFAAKQQELGAQQHQEQPIAAPPLPKPRSVVDKSHAKVAMQSHHDRPRHAEPHRPSQNPQYACNSDPLSCGWTHLSAGLSAVKKTLFGAPAKKQSPRASGA